MPIEFKFYTIPEVAKQVGLSAACLSAYCSQRKIGQKMGHSRLLSESDVERIKSRPRGRPKKNSKISSTAT